MVFELLEFFERIWIILSKVFLVVKEWFELK